MTLDILEVTSNLGQGLVLVYILIRAYRLIHPGNHSEHTTFFCFSVLSWVLSDLYWLAFSVLRPGMRMPLAPNMIAECAIFLFFAASITALRFDSPQNAVKEMIGAGIFMAANIALWIGWSGEWVQDFISGGCFAYMFVMVVCRLKQSGVAAKKYWVILAVVSGTSILLQTANFFVGSILRSRLDLITYILMYGMTILQMITCILAQRDGKDPEKAVCLSFFCLNWILVAMYMSSGVFYYVGMWACSLTLLIMLRAVSRVVQT